MWVYVDNKDVICLRNIFTHVRRVLNMVIKKISEILKIFYSHSASIMQFTEYDKLSLLEHCISLGPIKREKSHSNLNNKTLIYKIIQLYNKGLNKEGLASRN